MTELKDKVAVITGGASGIGAAIAMTLAREGCRIVLMDADAKGLADYESRIKALGFPVLAYAGDVSREADCRDAICRARDLWGPIHILVNNAGITQRGAFTDTQVPVFRRVMEVNFFGSLYCTKEALPDIIQGRGHVVVVESIAGVTPLPGRTGYCASKHALHGLFSTLRCEVRKAGVHVMIVCPGFIRTNLQTRALGCDGTIATSERTTVGKDYTPEMVAEKILTGLKKRTSFLPLTPAGRFGYWMNRISPTLFERIIEKKFGREM
ncbi:MAG: SDR family oxidoreductase [Pseudomonadota bacterium]